MRHRSVLQEVPIALSGWNDRAPKGMYLTFEASFRFAGSSHRF
ncbi:hypothetical protein ABE099_14135 [Paenibacillus turicensis]